MKLVALFSVFISLTSLCDAVSKECSNMFQFDPSIYTMHNVKDGYIKWESNGSFTLYGCSESILYINTNGILSFGSSFNSTNPENLPVSQTTPPFIAGFWSDLTLSQESLIAIAERSPTSTDYLYTRACMSQFLHEGFGGSAADYNPTHFVIVTWKDVTHHISESTALTATFQIILVSTENSPEMYALLRYDHIRWNVEVPPRVTVGFNAGDGVRALNYTSTLNLDSDSNTYTIGTFLYRVDGDWIIQPTQVPKIVPFSGDLHPFGNLQENLMPDSSSEKIELQGNYIYHGSKKSSLFICENGLISFEEHFCTPPPANDPDPNAPPTIAGFWADISIKRNVFAVSYDEISFEETDPGRETQFNDSKVYVLNLLREGFGGSIEGFDPTHIFVVTWNKASINNICCNTFQIVLVSQKNYIKTYALLLYSSISWMSSSVQPPLVGFHKEKGSEWQLYNPERRDVTTNARKPGAHVYRIDGDEILEPTEEQTTEDICILSYNQTTHDNHCKCCNYCTEEVKHNVIVAENHINCVSSCEVPESPDGCHVRVTGGTVGSQAHYTCSAGCEPVGDSTQTCTEVGTWSGTVPHCPVINCGGLCDLEKGTVLISHSTVGGVATYTCKPGYELEGSNRRECMPNGEWSGKEPNCTVVLCPELSAPENGDIGYDTIQHYYTSRAIYSCNSGYMLEGSDIRMCQRNGEWSGTPPICKSPLALKFVNNTPLVSEFKMTANFTANREGVTMICSIPILKISMDCSSGFFSHIFNVTEVWHLNAKKCILHVEATDTSTGESVTLSGSFRVFGHREKYFCSVNMINTGTELMPADGWVEFISVGNSINFTCEVDGEECPCGDSVRNITTVTPNSTNLRKIYRINIAGCMLMLKDDRETHLLVVEPRGGCRFHVCYKRMTYRFRME